MARTTQRDRSVRRRAPLYRHVPAPCEGSGLHRALRRDKGAGHKWDGVCWHFQAFIEPESGSRPLLRYDGSFICAPVLRTFPIRASHENANAPHVALRGNDGHMDTVDGGRWSGR